MKKLNNGLTYKKMDLHVHTPASYDFNNKEIILESAAYTSKTYNIGDKQNILINPNDTNEFMDNTQKFTGTIFTIVGALFVCAAVIFIFLIF